ncbi:LamG-like jellyroll fold domain-containing protein [Planomonospora sphaerica]|uniref:LamG-like jellyroll fold domain-containing protein n=1 Tax=Planomonospora sphaerica TaxID=161355 RepID=UPI0018D0A3E0|nr:LamG-like jellyroll fold domain-containing protein [Planomonospora sphaerica]
MVTTLALVLSSAYAAEASVLTPQPAAETKAPAVKPVTERPDRVSAALSARLQGSRVLITSETTETSLTYANPDGTLTTETTSGPVRIKQGERWTPIDTTLVENNGVLTPRAAAAQVEVSAGGDQAPLAKLEHGQDQSFALNWPTPLPAPRLEGNKATFADAAGTGADLVVTALPTGFRHDVVLREKPAGPVEFKLPLTTEGLTLKETKQGGLKLTDDKGKTVAAAPEPFMYDTTRNTPQSTAAAPEAAERGDIDTSVVDEGGRQVLVLKPDSEFLADPATVYPVTVDPTTTLTALADLTVVSPNSQSNGEQIMVGNVDYSSSRREFMRAVLAFDTSALVGQAVTDAKLELQSGGFDLGCITGQTVKAQRITGAWSHTSTFWSNQPATTTEGEQLAVEPGRCTGNMQVPAGAWTWPVTDIAKAWAGGAPGHGIMLRLVTEDPTVYKDQYQRAWQSSESVGSGGSAPKLVVTYGSTPVVEQLRAAPIIANEGTVYTSTTTPTLYAGARDPNGGPLRTEFEVETDPASGSTGQLWSGAVDGVTAGDNAKITVPGGKITDGAKIRWRARAYDGVDYSAWSAWQLLTVDASAPEPPTVICPEYEGGVWTNRRRQLGDPTTCHLTTDSEDRRGFRWGLDDPSTPNEAPLKDGNIFYPDGRPIEIDPQDGWRTLYVRSVDKAHNTSTVTAYSFGIGVGGLTKPAFGDRTQQAIALGASAPTDRTGVRYEYRTDVASGTWTAVPAGDVSVPGSAGPISSWPQTRTDTGKNFTDLTWNMVKTLQGGGDPSSGETGLWMMEEGTGTVLTDSSGHNRTATATGPITWAEGRNGKAVTFGAGTHAVTAGPVLRTDQSYTVSAWAKLTQDDAHASVISQDGTVNSGFKLNYSPGDKKWRMVAYTTDATGSTDTKAISSRPAKLNTWTHLTGVYDAQARKIRLYEDGELVAENDYTSTWNAGGGLLIGRSKLNGAYQHSFRGTIDEVRVYDKALAAQQIPGLMAPSAPAPALKAVADGPVQVRACFSGSDSEACSTPVTVTLDRSAFGGSYATEDLGPGEVALNTGDFALNESDAGIFGLSVGRSHTTLKPTADKGAAGVFGPGWRASFPTGSSGTSNYQLESGPDGSSLTLVGPSGETLSYAVTADGTFKGIGDAADGSKITIDSATQATHHDSAGIKTVFSWSGERWSVAKTEETAEESTFTYTRDTQGRVTRMVAPAPKGVTCGATLVAGCQALEFSYATATTATGTGSGWGDYTGQVKQISFNAYDPESAAMKTVPVVGYTYDSTGHLRTVTNLRSNLTTTYYYNAQGRVSQITPPGLAPWRMDYDAQGRIAHVQREGGDDDPTEAVVYNVPIGGNGAPVDLTSTQTAAWGQVSGLPRTGVATFPASRVPARGGDGTYHATLEDFKDSLVTYLDVNGREVNTATFGAGAWQIATTRYDDKGNAVWELTAGNRAQALTPTADTDPYVAGRTESAERANLLASVSTYNDDSDLLTEQGPAHQVQLASGAIATVRERSTLTYDQGKPQSNVTYHLVTTAVSEPIVLDGTATPAAADRRIARTGYDPIASGDKSGWDLRAPTSSTVVVDGQADIVRKTRYDAAGRVIEARMPQSNGADAGTTVTSYYTADGSGPEQCRKPEWAGLVCQSGPKVQPSTGKPLPISKVVAYNHAGLPTVATETAGSVVRTVTSSYDAAGRTVSVKTTVTPEAEGGVPEPETTTAYDPATGLATTITAAGVSTTTGYDAFGRPTSYTDADGNTSTATYTVDGKVATSNDGKGTTTYTYDGTDAAGRSEHRGFLTRIDVAAVGAFTGAYSADGELANQTYPNGLTASWHYDTAGNDIALTYTKGQNPWLAFTNIPGANDTVAAASSPSGSQRYGYDTAGRLTQVADTYNGRCVTRTYAFTANTNRSRLSTYSPAANGECSTSTSPATAAYAYDEADRLTNPGYAYDVFGRTTTVPKTDASGEADLTIGYHAGDMVASMTQGQASKTFTLDPEGRIRSTVQTGGTRPGTMINHYDGEDDEPVWIAEADGSWSRNIEGLGGDLAAIQYSTGKVALQVSNLHGDVVATVDNNTATTGVEAYFEQTEYGIPRAENTANPVRYGWHGSKQRSADALGGIILMGARLYNPATGRFLQVDPVEGGGDNDYAYPSDPVSQADLDGRIWNWVKKTAGAVANYVKKNPLDAALTVASFVPGLGVAAMAARGVRIAVQAAKILKAVKATRGAGMSGGLRTSRTASKLAGRIHVGRGAKKFKTDNRGYGYISKDRKRQWRAPEKKADGKYKSNFQSRNRSTGKWGRGTDNYHVYHKPPKKKKRR